jgi:cytochrome P450
MFEAGYEFLVGEPYDKVPGFEQTTALEIIGWLEEGEVGSRRRFLRGPLKHLDRDTRWKTACRSVQEFAVGAIGRGRLRMEERNTLNDEKSTLLEKYIQDFRDPIELRDLVIQVLMGLTTNGPGVLSHIVMELGKSPKLWERLREESMEFGAYDDSLSTERVRKMTYARYLLDEGKFQNHLQTSWKCFLLLGRVNIRNIGLRMYRITSTIFRSTLQDTVLPSGGGPDKIAPIFVPKNTLLFVCVWALHRDKAVFGPDADDFNPDRWRKVKPKRWEYIPFGGGPRACMGREMGITESLFVLCRLGQRYEGLSACQNLRAAFDEGVMCKVVTAQTTACR